MHRVLHRIAFAILAIVYITVNCGTLIGQMLHSTHHAVPLTVDGSSTPDGARGKIYLTPRRHLPMVRDLSTLAGLAPLTGGIPDIAEFSFVPAVHQPVHVHSLYYSVLSDRAPPRS